MISANRLEQGKVWGFQNELGCFNVCTKIVRILMLIKIVLFKEFLIEKSSTISNDNILKSQGEITFF